MRRKVAGETDQPAARGFAQIVVIEIFQLILAHIQSGIGRVVERNKLTVTARNLELANNEGGGVSRIRCYDT